MNFFNPPYPDPGTPLLDRWAFYKVRRVRVRVDWPWVKSIMKSKDTLWCAESGAAAVSFRGVLGHRPDEELLAPPPAAR